MITDKIKQAMFNGRTNKGGFRRGFWDVNELKQAKIENKPDVPADAVKVFYADGCIAFYINDKKQIVKNTNNRCSETTMAIIAMFQEKNKGMQIVDAELDGAKRGGGSARDWDAVFQM